MISTHKFSKKQKQKCIEWLNKQIIRNPTKELRTIYERRILLDHSYLRAEKYDSPEHKDELKEIQKQEKNEKIPRNKQNPNFDKLMELFDQVKSSKTFQEIINNLHQLREFVGSFGFRKYPPNHQTQQQQQQQYTPQFLNLSKNELDPRLFEQEHDFDHYLNYLLTIFKYQLQEKELEIFLQLTNENFDDQSTRDCLDALRETKHDLEEYQKTANQITEALNRQYHEQDEKQHIDPLNYELSVDKFENNLDNLDNFLNYLFTSFT